MAKKRFYTLVDEGTKQIDILNIIYPVGTVYEASDDSFDPNTDFGVGVWERVEAGRFLEAGNGSDGKEKVEAGLPAPVGYFECVMRANAKQSGFALTDKSNYVLKSGTDMGIQHSRINLDLAKSNPSLIGTSNTVQPKAYKVNIWERIE